MKLKLKIRLDVILFLFLIIILIQSCTNNPKVNVSFYKAVNTNLLKSSSQYLNNTNLLLEKLKDYQQDSNKSLNIKNLYDECISIHNRSDDIYLYIYNLKRNLKKEAGYKIVDGLETFEQDDFKSVKNFLYVMKKLMSLKKN